MARTDTTFDVGKDPFGPPWALESKSHPFATLSETLKTNTTSLVLHAKSNPNYQILESYYSAWQSNLKDEAQKRLGGFKPPRPLLEKGLLAEDWDLLKRVSNHQPLLTSGSMKRSASENSLESLGSSSSSASNRKLSRQWGWTDHQDASQSYNFSGEANLYGNRMPGIKHQHQLQQEFPQRGGPYLLPRVPTAPSLQELSETLNNGAARNLEVLIQTSKLAIQSAQESIQQTAVNCQQNLQTLSTILQQNIHANPKVQSALSGSRALVTWSIANSSDPLGGALVPWSVFPRVLRAREMDAHSSETDDITSSGKDWYQPLEAYMSQLEQKQKWNKASLRDPGRQVAIVTTASLPWLTGTAVNPLLRAAYLATDGNRKVTLVLPWLSMTDQQRVFPNNLSFETPEQQEEYVRDWARRRTGLDCNFKVTFYPGRYAAEKGSILPVGDITQVIPDHEADVAVLEEPEHLNWFHHGKRWTDKFNHVVGVMHTNYLDYARREENGNVKEALLKHINAWVCRIHCHKVIKLSDAVQPLPRQETMFVHGVSPAFLQVGEVKSAKAREGESVWGKGVYFLGKVLWAKGYTELLDRLKEHAERTGEKIPVDVYGSGPDLRAVEEESNKRALRFKFNGALDHAHESIHDYKVFINPSLSDVVATTTAEALAMGKFVVCADHPSNRFFARFPNCLIYRSNEEFSHCLKLALESEPKPLTPDELHSLTWEAATERFLDVAEVKRSSRAGPLEQALDSVLHAAHNAMTGVEFFRVACGAGSRTRDMPARITDYQPSDADVGGLFDNHARARSIYQRSKGSS